MRARRLILDECVTKSIKIEGKVVKKMANNKYYKSCSKVSQITEEQALEYEEARLRNEKLLIK